MDVAPDTEPVITITITRTYGGKLYTNTHTIDYRTWVGATPEKQGTIAQHNIALGLSDVQGDISTDAASAARDAQMGIKK